MGNTGLIAAHSYPVSSKRMIQAKVSKVHSRLQRCPQHCRCFRYYPLTGRDLDRPKPTRLTRSGPRRRPLTPREMLVRARPEALEVLLGCLSFACTLHRLFRWPIPLRRGTALTTQVARATDIRVATLIEPKQPIDFLRQSNASTPRETHRTLLIIHAQPERSRGT